VDELEKIKLKKLEEMMRKQEGSNEGGEKMKVAVPTMGNSGMDEYVSEHFGRAPTFTVVDLDKNDVKVLPNTSEHMGGVGYPPELMAKEGVYVMLCSGLGPRAIGMFEQYGIEVYVGASGTVRDAIKAWQAGMLQEATDENACKMHRH
jgi:predicted Fe-Mo cluster-binding NifX family protein